MIVARTLKPSTRNDRHDTLLSASTALPNVKSPRPITYVPSTPLNDLVLHETYGAAVDVHGDVWMWGKGHFGNDSSPERASASLRGKVGQDQQPIAQYAQLKTPSIRELPPWLLLLASFTRCPVTPARYTVSRPQDRSRTSSQDNLKDIPGGCLAWAPWSNNLLALTMSAWTL